MGRKKSGAGVVFLIAIGLTIWLFTEYPTFAWLGVGIIVVIGILMVLGFGPSSCQVCGAGLKKTKYTWEIHGEKKIVCPTCNRRLQSKKSKQAVDDLFT